MAAKKSLQQPTDSSDRANIVLILRSLASQSGVSPEMIAALQNLLVRAERAEYELVRLGKSPIEDGDTVTGIVCINRPKGRFQRYGAVSGGMERAMKS